MTGWVGTRSREATGGVGSVSWGRVGGAVSEAALATVAGVARLISTRMYEQAGVPARADREPQGMWWRGEGKLRVVSSRGGWRRRCVVGPCEVGGRHMGRGGMSAELEDRCRERPCPFGCVRAGDEGSGHTA